MTTITPTAAATAAFLVAQVFRQAELAGRHESDIKTEEFLPIADRVGFDALELALRVQAQLCFAEADALQALAPRPKLSIVPKSGDAV
jgi:hypothetical protein